MIGMTNGNAGGGTRMPPHNWLDNSDFTNLVAQAGIGGNHGTQAYAADRWILESGTVEYTAGLGLTLNGTIVQRLERAPTVASCFVGMASGTATITLDGSTVTITSAGGTIKWAALYEGSISSARMPVYQPKGYAAEYLECCRYFYALVPAGSGFISNGQLDRCFTSMLPIPMRATPSVELSPNFSLTVRTISGYDNVFVIAGGKPTSVRINERVDSTKSNAIWVCFSAAKSSAANNTVASFVPVNGATFVGCIADI